MSTPTPDALRGARRAATAAGLFTGVLGSVLLADPGPSRRLAARAGWPLDATAARLIGLNDLALAPGLVAGRPRWPWMAGRAASNLLLVAFLASEARRAEDARVPAGIAAALLAVTVVDGAATRTLRAAESG